MARHEWQPVRKLRTHEHVLGQIAERILDGRLSVGDRLPSERELVSALEVSRTSVREALRILESMGIVEANVGSGRDAGSMICGQPTEALSNMLRLHTALSRFHLGDLVELRIQLERSSAARAADSAKASEIMRLKELVTEMRTAEIEHEKFHQLDTEFHVTIARISGNPLVTDLMHALRGAVRTHMENAFQAVQNWDTVVTELSGEHLAIARAIESREPSLAAKLVAQHIAGFYSRYSDVDVEWERST